MILQIYTISGLKAAAGFAAPRPPAGAAAASPPAIADAASAQQRRRTLRTHWRHTARKRAEAHSPQEGKAAHKRADARGPQEGCGNH